MRTVHWTVALALAVALVLGASIPAWADEADNFTCRARLRTDSLGALDEVMNARILEVLSRVNRRGSEACDADCLAKALRDGIGDSDLHPLTFVPHARFERWVDERKDVERCRLRLSESIYGARAYNQPWLWPFNGRIILLADSIRLSGRTVGIDKLNHFIREGLVHWRDASRPGGNISAVMAKELGAPGRPLRWNEYGLKGWSLTGVLAWADLAASYSGYRFWNDLLSLDRETSLVAYDDESGRYVPRRTFTFAAYVTDAWDEGINYSDFHPDLQREVSGVLARRGQVLHPSDCRVLATLPNAELYVNPACTAGALASR